MILLQDGQQFAVLGQVYWVARQGDREKLKPKGYLDNWSTDISSSFTLLCPDVLAGISFLRAFATIHLMCLIWFGAKYVSRLRRFLWVSKTEEL